MNRRRVVIVLLGVALIVGVYSLVQVSIRRLDFFRIRSVEVVGIRHLDEKQLVASLALPADAHIAVDLDPIAESARGITGVRQATVDRRWPGTLVVTISEAPAVALVVDDGQLLVLDDRGGILPVDPARLTHSLPLAERDTALAALLGRLQATDPQWFQAVDQARVDGREAVLEVAGQVVRLNVSADSRVLLDLAVVREWLERNVIEWTAIDARFQGRLFVRRGAA